MKKGNLVLLVAAVGLMLLLVGCDSGNQEAAETPAVENTTTVAEAHDCDGGCGMTAVPMDHLTEVNGKFYCGGCVEKAKADAEGTTEETEEEHEGHSHG